MICFRGLTVSGASRLKRLQQISSINCGNGAFHVSCVWLSIFPNLSGFKPSSLAICTCLSDRWCFFCATTHFSNIAFFTDIVCFFSTVGKGIVFKVYMKYRHGFLFTFEPLHSPSKVIRQTMLKTFEQRFFVTFLPATLMKKVTGGKNACHTYLPSRFNHSSLRSRQISNVGASVANNSPSVWR